MRVMKVVAVLVAVANLACSSSGSTSGSSSNGGYEPIEHAEYVTRYRGPDLEVEVNYRWAERTLGDELMILRVALAAGKMAFDVHLENIHLRTPDGTVIRPMEQTELHKVYYGPLRLALSQANAWGPPSSRFMASRAGCGVWFVTPPDAPGPRSKKIYPSRSQVCFGPLVFQVPTGIQPGRWTMVIDLEESQARIPFELDLTVLK